MTSNEELVQKAITAADALASAGRLNMDQANTFLDYVVDETTWKNHARVVRMDGGTGFEISKIGVGSRVLLPASEAQDPGVRRGVTTSKITMEPREFILPVEISDSFVEENIQARQGGDVNDLIMKLFARQLANDLESMAWHGRTLGHAVLEGDILSGGSSTQYIKDPLWSMFNGWLKYAEGGNVYDHAGAAVGSKLFSQMFQAMPTKFRRNRSNLRMHLPANLYQLMLETFSNRQGAQADGILNGSTNGMNPFGLPTVETPLFEMTPRVVEHITMTGTTAQALLYKNFTNVVVTPSTLGTTLTTPYVLDTDYSLQASAGTITRIGGGISDGQVVKVTYDAPPAAILTPKGNFIVCFSRDIRIEKERDIMKRTNRYAVTFKAAISREEDTAIVLAKNIATTV